jgi:hypothetical protein
MYSEAVILDSQPCWIFNLLDGSGFNSTLVFWFLVVIMRTDIFVLELRVSQR